MKGQSDSSIISFSDMICCCCRVSTIYESKEISIFILIDRWNDENYSYSKFPFCISIATWLFFICLSAKDFCFISPAICTSSTRPKPPTPNVAIIRKSCSFRLLNSSWILQKWSCSNCYKKCIYHYLNKILKRWKWCRDTWYTTYIFFLSGKSIYLFFMSSRSFRWWKDSRSITRQVTPCPSLSSAIMFAVRFSSLQWKINCCIKRYMKHFIS